MPVRIFDQLTPSAGVVIAEIACGHDGKIEQLKQLIGIAARAGADFVKFQIFSTQERAIVGKPEWDIFSKLELSGEAWQEAVNEARRLGLGIFADVYGAKSLDLADRLGVDGFKIHSEDLLNSYFIADVVARGKLVIIGVGAAHRIEIVNLLKFLESKKLLNNIVLMTGVQTFPTPLEAHSLTEVSDLVAKYATSGHVKIGFSDHLAGDLPDAKVLPLMALANGAHLIEKHFTLNRQLKWTDYQSALGEADFIDFVKSVKRLATVLKPIKPFNEWEDKYRKMFKKTPCANKDLSKGHVMQAEDIVYRKDTQQAVPLASLDIVGQPLGEDLKVNGVLRVKQLKPRVGIVIVARCTSNRLPNKAILPIAGRESIAVLIDRMKRVKHADSLVLATSTDRTDDVLVEIAKREGILSYRGSLDNVAERFYQAAKSDHITQIVRVTGDAIMCDEIMLDKIIEHHLEHCCDVTFMKNMPYGTAKEIFSLRTIETILNTVYVPSNTEYLEWFLENTRYFNVGYVDSGYQYDPSLRITLDFEEDLKFFNEVYNYFISQGKKDFTLTEALAWLSKNPQISLINKHKTPKFTSSDLNVSLKI